MLQKRGGTKGQEGAEKLKSSHVSFTLLRQGGAELPPKTSFAEVGLLYERSA